jgi:hypothetical protein
VTSSIRLTAYNAKHFHTGLRKGEYEELGYRISCYSGRYPDFGGRFGPWSEVEEHSLHFITPCLSLTILRRERRDKMFKKSLVIFTAAIMWSFAVPSHDAVANKSCPIIWLTLAQGCFCSVTNYALTPDTGVYIQLYANAGPEGEQKGPITVQPGYTDWNYFYKSEETWDFCGCKVTGEASTSRVTIFVTHWDGTLIQALPCN